MGYKQSKIVLVFNGGRILVAILHSLNLTADFTRCNLQAISFCCTGKYIQTGGYYFRHLNPDVIVESNDIDKLNIEEYDNLCGDANRRYHPVRRMKKYRKDITNYKLNQTENGNEKKHPSI